jgi:exonuclease III
MARQSVIGNYYQVLPVDEALDPPPPDHNPPHAPALIAPVAPIPAAVQAPRNNPPVVPQQININIPKEIPHFTQYSLNLKGVVAEKVIENKMAWIKHNFYRKKVGAVHFQETHFKNKTEACDTFRRLGGKIIGLAFAPNRSAGLLTWVPADSPIYDLIIDVDADRTEGRWASMRIRAQEELIFLANIYAPSDCKVAREAFFKKTKDKLEHPNLILCGDFNFVTEAIDKITLNGPSAVNPHPVSTGVLEELDLEDLFRFYHEDEIMITFRHVNKTYFARLDRFYVNPWLTEECEPLPTISGVTVSDHDAIGMAYKSAEPSDRIVEPHYRMSRALLKVLGNPESNAHIQIKDLIAAALESLQSRREVDPTASSHPVWDDLKSRIRNIFMEYDRIYKNRRKIKVKALIKIMDYSIPSDADQAEHVSFFNQKNEALEALKTEEQIVLQNIKATSEYNWLSAGEHSNKLFFQHTTARIKQNRIPDLVTPTGGMTQTPAAKKKVAADAYQHTFSKRLPDPEALDKVLQSLDQTQNSISQDDIDTISTFIDIKNLDPPPPTDDDPNPTCWIRKTIESIKMYKAPGPDGIPNDFYYIFRMNPNLTKLLREVFKDCVSSGSLPDSMRETYYKLLYKKGFYSEADLKAGLYDNSPKNPRDFGNWRPIALLPCDSKIFSAYMADNLKHHLDGVISKSQSAFVPGRSIHENIMLVQQMIHYHNQTNEPAGLVFVDFAHAYDYISQEYILAILHKLKFPPAFVDIIEMLMHNQTGRVLVNGDLSPTFTVDNGGKQGDPLFPMIYILALEGFNAMMEAHPGYSGVTAPDGTTKIKHSGYCDDCCVAVGDSASDRQALTEILKTFELASGNEVKKVKSYIIWLGSLRGSTHTIYDIKSLEQSSERYLGIQIASTFDPAENWSKVIKALPCQTTYWSTLGLSIFGRTLMINSSMLSKIWFVAMHTPPDNDTTDKLNKHVNNYFRKGRRSNSIAYQKRITPTEHGGLGQLDIQAQLDNLLAKWVIKSKSGDTHPWNIYWQHNTDELKKWLNTTTDPLVLDINWATKRGAPHLFHMILPAYKAWHAIKLTADITTFEGIMSMPLYNNKHIKNQATDKAVAPGRIARRLLAMLNQQGRELLISDLLTEVTPEPTAQFDLSNPATWRMRLQTPAELNTLHQLNVNPAHWLSVQDDIPPQLLAEVMKGPAPVTQGWAATIIEDDDGVDQVGDIYLVTKHTAENADGNKETTTMMSHYTVATDDTLTYRGSNNTDWVRDILPDVAPLAVSVIAGRPHLIGWATQHIGTQTFLVPPTPREIRENTFESIEHSIGTTTYNDPETSISYNKPKFNSLFKKVRKKDFKPLPALAQWQPDADELANHQDDGPCEINWARRFKLLHNCTFIVPKYRQLIQWITTETLCDGYRLNKTNPTRGLCPFCGTVADTKHMFNTCPRVREYWRVVNTQGRAHWGNEYYNLITNDIPTLLSKYQAIKLYHLSALWALWTNWCKLFYEEPTQDYTDNWVKHATQDFQKQFVKRIAEAPAAVQWVTIAQEHRTKKKEDKVKVPEKEFLLVHTHRVKTRSKTLPTVDGNTHPLILEWVGNSYLVEIVDGSHHRPRLRPNQPPEPQLRIKSAAWAHLVAPEPPGQPAAPVWRVSLPRSVGMG